VTERRVGFIPRASTENGAFGVFVTDRRTIKVAYELPMGFMHGVKALFLEPEPEAFEPSLKIDFSTVDIEHLAGMEGNSWVSHTSIEKLAVGKGIGGYGIWMSYKGADEKTDYLIMDLTPPDELVRRRKMEGIGAKETRKRYAIKCQEVFRRALPPIIAEKVDWRI